MNKKGYTPPSDRKKILLLCDNITIFSGVATMAREIVTGTSHKFNWVNLGQAIKHPHNGKKIDLSDKINEWSGNSDSNVILYGNENYGDPNLLRQIIKLEKPDAVMIFTDPRYWVWLFSMEKEIRKKIPLIYYNIWDSTPPPLWNKPYYNSCDTLLGISKQTVNLNKIVLGDDAKNKIIEYIPHGINENIFKPLNINDKDLENFKKQINIPENKKFIALFNSRNLRRKNPSDLLFAWKLFCDNLTPKQFEETALLLHTDPIDNHGTNLFSVVEALFGDSSNVYFSNKKLSSKEMNLLYNISDVTILPSSNEGWGLSLTESLMAGTMIIANVTGGMQDQMRFENDEGEWINFNEKFLSNHFGTYKKCGDWAFPVFPSNSSVMGSPPTPYIYDDRLDFRELAETINNVYNLSKEEIKIRGLKGRDWVTSEESMMSSKYMCNNMIKYIEETLNNFQPQPSLELIKVSRIKPQKLTTPIIY